jgi:hypothetical protein
MLLMRSISFWSRVERSNSRYCSICLSISTHDWHMQYVRRLSDIRPTVGLGFERGKMPPKGATRLQRGAAGIARPASGGKAAHPRRGAAHGRQHRQAAGIAATDVKSRSESVVPPTPPAMPVKVVVNPASLRANRRPPEWVPPHRADNATDHQANRPGDHQTSTSTKHRANGIRWRTCRSSGNRENRCRGQQSLTHDHPPVEPAWDWICRLV